MGEWGQLAEAVVVPQRFLLAAFEQRSTGVPMLSLHAELQEDAPGWSGSSPRCRPARSGCAMDGEKLARRHMGVSPTDHHTARRCVLWKIL